MKKRLVVLFCCLSILLSGCGLKVALADTSEELKITILTSESGHTFLFRTEEYQEYFDFLENFDEAKYEIIDISTSMSSGYNGSGEFYIVTYQTKAE